MWNYCTTVYGSFSKKKQKKTKQKNKTKQNKKKKQQHCNRDLTRGS